MKYVSIRMPDDGPFGETLFQASDRAMVAALLVNKPLGGCVESVVTVLTQRFFFPRDFVPDATGLLVRGPRESGGRITREDTRYRD